VLAQRECHVLEAGHVGEQRTTLKQHPHAPPEAVEIASRKLIDGLAIDGDAPGGRPQLAADEAQQRRLAGSAGAHDRHDFAASDLQIHTVEQPIAAAAEDNTAQVDQGLGLGSWHADGFADIDA